MLFFFDFEIVFPFLRVLWVVGDSGSQRLYNRSNLSTLCASTSVELSG